MLALFLAMIIGNFEVSHSCPTCHRDYWKTSCRVIPALSLTMITGKLVVSYFYPTLHCDHWKPQVELFLPYPLPRSMETYWELLVLSLHHVQ